MTDPLDELVRLRAENEELRRIVGKDRVLQEDGASLLFKVMRERSAALAVVEAARRYRMAADAHEARDWETFRVENLGAVTVEYRRLADAIDALDAQGNEGEG